MELNKGAEYKGDRPGRLNVAVSKYSRVSSTQLCLSRCLTDSLCTKTHLYCPKTELYRLNNSKNLSLIAKDRQRDSSLQHIGCNCWWSLQASLSAATSLPLSLMILTVLILLIATAS